MPTKKIEEAEEVTRCPECNSGHLSFDYERGELICEECGLVLTDQMIDQGPEWRAFVVDRVGHRCARAGALLALFDVEGPPFWPLVDHLVRQDEAAFLTDELAALIIERQVARVALGASSDFFGFFDLLCRHGLPQQRTRRLQSTTARRPRRAVRPRRARGQVRRP